MVHIMCKTKKCVWKQEYQQKRKTNAAHSLNDQKATAPANDTCSSAAQDLILHGQNYV